MSTNKELLEKIISDNKAGGVKWKAGRTSMLELNSEEMKLRLGVAEDPNDIPLANREKIATAAYEKGETATDYTAPISFDWRNVNGKNFVGAIKNQGGCGSCVAFATTAVIDVAMHIATDLPIGNGNLEDLSEAELFYCGAGADGRTCGGSTAGWWVSAAMAYCTSNGLAPEAKFPYTAKDQPCTMKTGWQSELTKITTYQNLTSASKMKEWISLSGAMTAIFAVYQDFYAYSGGVYKYNGTAPLEGYHAICVVGYNDTTQAWICKNSWGTNWGVNGYFEIGYGQCGIDASMQGVNSFKTLYPYTNGNNYTLSIHSDGSQKWSPNNPNEQAGWLDGDTLEIISAFNLTPENPPYPNASAYTGLCIGATCNKDASTMSTLLGLASNLPTGTTGKLLGTGITTGAKSDATLFYNATNTAIPSISLSPSSRGTIENAVYKWKMTYNGANTVVNTEREIALIFGSAYKLSGIINQ